MSTDQKQADFDDWLNAAVVPPEQVPLKPPRTSFATVPSGVGVPKTVESPVPKPKTLQTLGIGRGGIVRNASTVVRQQLDNPIANPKGINAVKSSILDQENSLTPEFGVPTLMRGMDVNLEESAKQKAGRVLPAAPADAQTAQQKDLTMESSLDDALQAARANGGELNIVTDAFSLQIQIKRPF